MRQVRPSALAWGLIQRLGLWSGMALALTAGFAVLLVVFFQLASQAIEDTRQHIERERLTVAR